MARVGLGTVQLGLPYAGKAASELISLDEALAVMERAVQLGISFFDSAVIYGESEARIGEFLRRNPEVSIEVSSKLPRFPREMWSDEKLLAAEVERHLSQSLQRTGLDHYPLLQLHESDVEFLSSKAVASVMRRLCEDPRVTSLGVSVYLVDEALCALEQDWVRALQVPANILDQRFFSPDLVERYQSRDIRIIARSLFLQGVLVEGTSPPEVARKEELQDLQREAMCLSRQERLSTLSLRYVYWNLGQIIDVVLTGVQSVAELEANIAAFQGQVSPVNADLLQEFAQLGQRAEIVGLLDPRTWPQQRLRN